MSSADLSLTIVAVTVIVAFAAVRITRIITGNWAEPHDKYTDLWKPDQK